MKEESRFLRHPCETKISRYLFFSPYMKPMQRSTSSTLCFKEKKKHKYCKYLMINIYNSNPYVINYALSEGIWGIFVSITDSSLSRLQPLILCTAHVYMEKNNHTDRIYEFKFSVIISKELLMTPKRNYVYSAY